MYKVIFYLTCSRWVHVADGKCIHPLNGEKNPDNDTPLTAADCHPNSPEKIQFQVLPDLTYYNIQHMTSGEYLLTNLLLQSLENVWV